MIIQTWIFSVVFGLLAISRKASGAAIGVLIASMLVWPEYLRISLGLFEVSAPRFIALILIGQAAIRGKHRLITGCGVDWLVLMIWGWTVLATIFADASFSQVFPMIGRGLDTVLMYFVVRLYVTSDVDLRALVRWLIFVAVVMGTLGAIESITAQSPYSGMSAFREWTWIDKGDEFRYGFKRALTSTSVHIYFGLAMVVVTGLIWSINKGLPIRRFGSWGILFGIFGVLSSMSSGPWLGLVIMLAFGLYQNRPGLIRPSIVFVVFSALSLEVASNRHFYNLLDYLTLDPSSAWYRTRLVEIAASHLSDFWLFGVGAKWPHYWGMILDGRDHIDVVNNFLIVALYGGLPAMFLYVASHYLAISYVITIWKSGKDISLRHIAFYLACVLLALDLSCLSVGLYGPPLLLSHALLALIVAVTQMRQSPDPRPAVLLNSQTTSADHFR